MRKLKCRPDPNNICNLWSNISGLTKSAGNKLHTQYTPVYWWHWHHIGGDTAFEEEIKSSSGCRPMSKYRQMSRSDISCPPAFNGQSPIDRSTSALQMVMVLRNRIRTLPRGGMYQKMHPRDPRDFLRAVILHPEAREIVRGRSPRGNLEGRGTINYLRWI